MFNKNNRNESSDTDTRIDPTVDNKTARSSGHEFHMRSVSYVGPNLRFTGDIRVDEGLVIEGEIEGTIVSEDKTLTVGKQGRVHGEIRGNTVEVRGRVDGEIYGHTLVHLHSTALVEGSVYCRRIVMDEGGVLNGSVDMTWEAEKTAKGKLTTVETTGEQVAKAAG